MAEWGWAVAIPSNSSEHVPGHRLCELQSSAVGLFLACLDHLGSVTA